MIRESGFEVDDISAITHSPEILQGRVKTLHPAVHAGILSTDSASDAKDLEDQSIEKVKCSLPIQFLGSQMSRLTSWSVIYILSKTLLESRV